MTKTFTSVNSLSNFTINQPISNINHILTFYPSRRLRWVKPNTAPKSHGLLINRPHGMNNNHPTTGNKTPIITTLNILTLLSIGGLPPLSGFMPKPAWHTAWRRPNLQRTSKSPRVCNNRFYSHTHYNWRIWKLTSAPNNWSTRYSLSPYKQHKFLATPSYSLLLLTSSIVEAGTGTSLTPQFSEPLILSHYYQHKTTCHNPIPNTTFRVISPSYSSITSIVLTCPSSRDYHTANQSKFKVQLSLTLQEEETQSYINIYFDSLDIPKYTF
ncbi:hypothetical protein E2I00_012737 [Balaenoptera physalus]|uniref:NADH:ubiquinone reductase (H(+)-translocating) n=1 Tax=Balaenoptera physalus TaxID=9770 RepID=A0A643BQM2_BALPH|nr:hypothetical protein E2I00_012737 [Balaenoptera physalus]